MIGLSGTLRGQQIANEREGNTMTIKLPPHAIATDHPEHPAEKWSAAELSWIAARDKAFLAHVKDAIEAYKQQQGEAVPVAWLEQVTLASGSYSPPNQEWRVTQNPSTSSALRKPLYTHSALAQQPLSDDEIATACAKVKCVHPNAMTTRDIARAIERAHGIGGEKQ